MTGKNKSGLVAQGKVPDIALKFFSFGLFVQLLCKRQQFFVDGNLVGIIRALLEQLLIIVVGLRVALQGGQLFAQRQHEADSLLWGGVQLEGLAVSVGGG